MELYQTADLSEMSQVIGAKVEHGHTVAEHTAPRVYHKIAAGLADSHGSQPLQGFRLVQLDTKAPSGIDHL